MGFHLYCVTRSELAAPRDLCGVGGISVRPIEAGSLGCWVTEHETRPTAITEHAQAHNAVVTAAIREDHTPVPLRFGQWLEGEADVVKALAARADAWTDRLTRLSGALEFGIRVVDPDVQPVRDVQQPVTVTGRDYMQALKQRVGTQSRIEEARTRLRAQLADLFGPLVRAEVVENMHTAHGVASVSHLVERTHFDAYQNALLELRIRMPTLRFLKSGPWPPYSFV